MATKYFTSHVSGPPDKQKRQATFLEALQTLNEFKIFYGKFQMNPRNCRNCGFQDAVQNEKMTDVNIAVELLTDAFQDSFDAALPVSADSDLTSPLVAVRRLFPTKRTVVAFPPRRFSKELAKAASAYLVIGRGVLAASVFPPQVRKQDGFVLNCPPTWR